MVSNSAGILPDIANYLVVLLTISFFTYRGAIRPWVALVLSLSALAPFFLNDFLFPATYMPDQFVYTKGAIAVRGDGFDAVVANNTGWASRALAMAPIPFIDSVRSLGFANKLIYCSMVVWLVRSYFLRGSALLFVLLYPSVVLYTGLSLRDTLIMLLMVMTVVLAIERRWLLALALLVPLGLIKFQNAVILLAIIVIYAFYISGRGRRGIGALVVVFTVSTAAFFVLSMMYLDLLNLYRLAMVVEDGGRPSDVEPITSSFGLISSGLGNAVFFLLKPYPWAAGNALQFVQSVENLAVAAFLGWFTWQSVKLDRARTLFWVASLLFAFAVYGLVVANFGTAARYRFPFLVMYVIALALDVNHRPKVAPPVVHRPAGAVLATREA